MREELGALFRRTRHPGEVDVVFAASVVALLGFGVVMVYSASVIEALTVHNDPQYFVKRQGVYAVLGLVVMMVMSRIDYHKLRVFVYALLFVVFGLLVYVALFGHTGGGATRWINLGPVHFQPSELAKVAMIMWLSHTLAKKTDKIKDFYIGLAPSLVVVGILCMLLLKQPDFGGALVLAMLTMAMLFVAGAKVRWLLPLIGVGLFGAFVLIRFTGYRFARWQAWRNMAEHRQDLAYQPFQSVMSFGSGEVTGLGLGDGLQVLYLPESHTDFIAAIVGEELGFLGLIFLCGLYTLLVARGVRTALRAEDDFGTYVAFGISVMFGLQALINLGVTMAMLPTKGLTLPFISYGGSSLVVSAGAAGILLNVSRQRRAARNVRVADTVGPEPEASATLITEADFAPGDGVRDPAAADADEDYGRLRARKKKRGTKRAAPAAKPRKVDEPSRRTRGPRVVTEVEAT